MWKSVKGNREREGGKIILKICDTCTFCAYVGNLEEENLQCLYGIDLTRIPTFEEEPILVCCGWQGYLWRMEPVKIEKEREGEINWNQS